MEKKLSFAKKLGVLLCLAAFSNLSTAQVKINTTNYPTLYAAVDAINDGHYINQDIVILITGNTTETQNCSISPNETPHYNSITIRPSGTGEKTVLFNAGVFSFFQAHNITFDGLNQLTFASTVVNQNTLRFNSSNNITIKNCKLLGRGSDVISIYGSSVSNITIKQCEVAPYDALAALPKGCIDVAGTTSGGQYATNIVIEENLVHDFSETGINVSQFKNASVKNNRIYHTEQRSASIFTGIRMFDMVASGGNEIKGNEIGSASASGTGLSVLLCQAYYGIDCYPYHSMGGESIAIENNNIRNISLIGNASQMSFKGIVTQGASVLANNNIIDNITVLGLNSTGCYVSGLDLHDGSSSDSSYDGTYTVTNNSVTAINVSSSNNAQTKMEGISIGGSGEPSGMELATCSGNTVDGLISNSTHANNLTYGISINDKRGVVSGNTVRNITSNGGNNQFGLIGLARSMNRGGDTGDDIARNTIYNLSNKSTSGTGGITGIYSFIGWAFDAAIRDNMIYGLNAASTNDGTVINGIYVTRNPINLYNNMIALNGSATGAAEINGIQASFSDSPGGMGLNIKHNSVFIGGIKGYGSAPSRCLYNTGNYSVYGYMVVNNIFMNNRSNFGTSTASHYSIVMFPNWQTYNRYFANVFYGTGNGYIFGKTLNNISSLAAWNNSSPYAYGYVGDPRFINPAGATPNLHINPSVPSIIEARGDNSGGSVPADYDAETRADLTPIDIGADAGSYLKLVSPAITGVSATTLCTNSSFEVTGTGLNGVAQAKIGSTVVSIANATETSLTINTGGEALSGTLSLSNALGTATYPTTINIYAPPVITQQPVSATACYNAPVSFSVAATDAVTYHWRKDGVDLENGGVYSGVDTPTLNILSAIVVPVSASFDVVVTGTAGACTVTSSAAILATNVPPSPVVSASGSTSICQGNSVTLSTNYNGPALQFDGVDDYFNFPRNFSNDFTVEYWVKTTQTGTTGSQWYNGKGIVDASLTGTLSSQREFGTALLGNKLAFGIGGEYNPFAGYNTVTIQSNTPINTGQWIHVAVTRKESTGLMSIYINGVLDAIGSTLVRGAITTSNIRVGGLQKGGGFFNGAIDDIRVWSYVKTAQQIRAGMSHSYPGTSGLVNNFTINENGGGSTFNTATGGSCTLNGGPTWVNRSTTSNYLNYAWSNGANTPTITVSASGNYSVQVTDADGCTGNAVPVSVNVQSVSVSPSLTVCKGTPTTLTASGAVAYSWSPATGLNTTSGPSVIATPTTTTTYTVTGTMASGCQNSKQVTVTVNSPVTISASQLNIMPGGSTTLVASGGTNYNWSPATGLNTTSGPAVIATPAVTTTYAVTSSGCTTPVMVTISVLPEPSASNNALDFDGIDDYVSLPAQTGSVTGSFTVEAWVKPTHPTKTMHIISSRNGQDNSFDIQITDGNKIHGDIGNGSGWLTTAADATFSYSANTWFHIAYVVTPSEYRIYANGNLVGNASLSGTPLLYSPTRFFTIGKNTTENTFFQGTIDDIRIYDTALSGEQIQNEMVRNYQSAGLLAYFNCNEGTAGGNNAGINKLVEQDIVDNFHGTLHNFALSGNTSNWVEGQVTQEVSQPQFIGFLPLEDVVYGAPDIILTAAATSGLPVFYQTSNPNVATVNGNVLTIHGAGPVEITALQGGNASYDPAFPVSQVLNVLPKPITMVDIMVADKYYDGNTSTAIAANFDGLLWDDEVFALVDATFESPDAGNNIPVNIAFTLEGEESANYTLIQPTGVVGNIFPKPVTIANASANDKLYDGTVAATISGTLSGIISPDAVSITSNAGSFAVPNPGSNISVTPEMTIGGAAAANYVLEQPTGLSANIIAAGLTAAFTGATALCQGQSTSLSVTVTGGSGQYFVEYTDGTNVFVLSNYSSGDAINVNPSDTTTYTLLSVNDINSAADVSGINPVTVIVFPLVNYYADADHDGYGNAAVMVQSCTPVPNYVLDDTDCDDTKATMNPGAAEIGYNLIDDDCDGLVDEGFPIKATTITADQCSTLLPAIDAQLIADIVAGAQGYQWRITTVSGPNTGQVQFLNTSLRVMKLTQLANYAYNTTYRVEVAVYFGGFLQPYTESTCTVTTPQFKTQLANCGQTLNALQDIVYANLAPFATGYKFRITDPIVPSNTQEIVRTVREFRMNLITAFTVQYGKAYQVEVAVRNTNGEYMDYGPVCSVITPAFPTTSIQDSQCDAYAPPTMATQIYAVSYPGAIAYVFNIVGNGLPADGIEITKATRNFKLADFAGLLPGATYNVRVRLIFNYNDAPGSYGKTCTVVVPGLSRMAKLPFDAKAYPNPFADNFNIDVRTSSKAKISIKVYDMTGRLLESRSVSVQEIASMTIGDNFPSGVYNIIVNQDEAIKTLRVVKR